VFIIPTFIAGYFVVPHISIKQLVVFVATVTIMGGLYDLWATKHGKRDPVWIWSFNSRDTIGLKFLGVPIEEYLFYVFTSTYVVFIWESISIALETKSFFFWFLPPAIGLWTLVCVSISYKLNPKKDRLIG